MHEYCRTKKANCCEKKVSSTFNPNWHETGQIYLTYNFWIGFCQLNFYQKFENIFVGES